MCDLYLEALHPSSRQRKWDQQYRNQQYSNEICKRVGAYRPAQVLSLASFVSELVQPRQ